MLHEADRLGVGVLRLARGSIIGETIDGQRASSRSGFLWPLEVVSTFSESEERRLAPVKPSLQEAIHVIHAAEDARHIF